MVEVSLNDNHRLCRLPPQLDQDSTFSFHLCQKCLSPLSLTYPFCHLVLCIWALCGHPQRGGILLKMCLKISSLPSPTASASFSRLFPSEVRKSNGACSSQHSALLPLSIMKTRLLTFPLQGRCIFTTDRRVSLSPTHSHSHGMQEIGHQLHKLCCFTVLALLYLEAHEKPCCIRPRKIHVVQHPALYHSAPNQMLPESHTSRARRQQPSPPPWLATDIHRHTAPEHGGSIQLSWLKGHW